MFNFRAIYVIVEILCHILNQHLARITTIRR